MQTIKAVFEKCVFRPLEKAECSEGQLVEIRIEPRRKESTEGMIALAARVYEGLSAERIKEIEGIALERRDFFIEERI